MLVSAPRHPASAAGAYYGGLPCPKGLPQIGGTMPKSPLRRNAAEARIRRFLKGFTGNVACPSGARPAVRSGDEMGWAKIQEPAPSYPDRAGSLAISVHP